MCDMDCFNCKKADCDNDIVSDVEIRAQEQFDREIINERKYGKARKLWLYEISLKGRVRKHKYFKSAKGKAALKKYAQSDKGKENAKQYLVSHPEVLEEVEMIEVKQGPYSGEQDKKRFTGIEENQIVYS